MIETLQAGDEFERKPHREIEKKYVPLFPETLNRFRADAVPIEQLYLSHPFEPFSLRLRETFRDSKPVYSATLKDRGQLTADGIDRLEIETEISEEAYLYYKNLGFPTLRKLRAEPYKNIVIDWFEDNHVQIEAEHPMSMTGFVDQHRLVAKHFSDHTGDKFVDNEWRAHEGFRRGHNGDEALSPPPEFDPERVAEQIWRRVQAGECIVTIAGRSGSGKSTAIAEIRSLLTQNGVRSIVLSTDNYNRGRTWLENYSGKKWDNWDAPIVYDLELLQADLRQLMSGEDIPQRCLNFETEEPIIGGVFKPAPVILVEGIYANHPSFAQVAELRYEISTPLATCVGRRLLRDVKERPGFADPSYNLRYILEVAEPSYKRQLIQQ